MSAKCTDIINLRYQDGGLGSPSNPDKFNRQDFKQLKDYYVSRGRLFVDNTFPPDRNSLGAVATNQQQVQWLRPADIMRVQGIGNTTPSFFVEGASRFDFGQGNVGNCWFLAAISSLTLKEDLMWQVVPREQSFNDYAGIFHFRFWRFGKWVDVVIDDLLPTFHNKYISVRSKSGTEFWVPLLEKAYAKLCGSYGDMDAGNPSEAFVDFSGGVHMNYELRAEHDSGHDEELWGSLSRASGCKSMICVGTSSKGGPMVNSIAPTGLVNAHAYSVTGFAEVKLSGSNVRLVRLLNPWGSQEWNGKWSDNSDLWKQVSAEDRQKRVKKDNGEFWMELEDFCFYFTFMSICCENPNFIDGDVSCQWKCMIYDSSWIAGKTAGGNPNEPTFAMNPQFRLKVKSVEGENRESSNLLLSLMQKPSKHRKQSRYDYAGLTIYEVPPGKRLDSNFFRYNRPVKQSAYSNARELTQLIKVDPGEYVVVPSTMDPNLSGEFVLTVYTKTDMEIDTYDGDDNHDHGDHGDHDGPEEADKEVTPKPDEGGENSELERMFKRYADQFGKLSDRQLLRLLNENLLNGSEEGLDISTCRTLIAITNGDRKRTIDFQMFLKLWGKCENYKKNFIRSDVDRSGTLSEDEVLAASKTAGMNLDASIVSMLTFHYSGFYDTVTLGGFIPLMLRLQNIDDVFNSSGADIITINWSTGPNSLLFA